MPTGEGETLKGRKLDKFGDRVIKGRAIQNDQDHGQSKNTLQGTQIIDQETHNLKNVNFGNLQVNQQLQYNPKTRQTRNVYEQLVHLVQKYLGDVSTDVLLDCTDEIIAILKQDEIPLANRKLQVDKLIGLSNNPLQSDIFNQFVVWIQMLTDYETDKVSQNINKAQEMVIDFESDEDGDAQVEEIVELDIKDLNQELSDQEAQQDVIQGLQINEIDDKWLQNKLQSAFTDIKPEQIIEFESKILYILGNEELSLRDCEKKILVLLKPKRIDLIKVLVADRFKVYFSILLQQTTNEKEKHQIQQTMKETKEGRQMLIYFASQQILNRADIEIEKADYQNQQSASLNNEDIDTKFRKGINKLQTIELDQLIFQQGPRLMANKKCTLPKGSTRITKAGYEEVYVPAPRSKQIQNQNLIAINSLPDWAQSAFPSYMTHLNKIQSALYQSAFKTPDNLLVCAPTGAGKTNIALLACLQLLDEMKIQNQDGKTSFNLKKFKIIYIAPMKALVSEVVGNFQARLEPYGIQVKELTGDVHLSKQQIDQANIIVTTPEKWDIITRKSGQRAYIELVKLIIIDEVHLLHDSRGPVLESIIARTIRQVEETQELVRIVGLSATLPNYQDVAALLRVDPDSGLYFFDNTHRPVPLEQVFVGITEKKAVKKLLLMNEICYEKVMERVDKHQLIVFTHSRKETARTAKIIRDMALAQEKLESFVKENSESKKILIDIIVDKKQAVSRDLQDLVPYGIGIHHAGLSKEDRKLVEDLFAAGHIKVLISTATLAWGVNLPAHTVIIKGTQIYSPEQGKWIELSTQDILQMMGRAGRPQYDTLGEGIIITSHSDLQYYLSLNNQQLPIESQMISCLADQLNAEIVLGSVSNLKEAVDWLSYTYLYIRMRRNPELYGVEPENFDDDQTLIQRRLNLIHSAALKLQKSGMIKYDKRTGSLLSTALGKVASHYYIKCSSMQIYSEELKPHMNTIDIFRLFALSQEFESIPVRENEKVELQKFIDRVPIPVKGSLEETATKINILLQAFIARFHLDGYDLNADMVYVTQSAGRIMRALFEIALQKGWAQLSDNLLNACKMVEKRQWYSMTPLRQFANNLSTDSHQSISKDLMEVARRIERKEQFKWIDFYEFSAQKLGELVKFPKMGQVILSYVHKFPRLDISAFVQPITRSTVRIELELKTHEKFQWDARFHGWAEPFWIFVQDGDGEQILHHEQFLLKESHVGIEQHLSFYVPLFDPLPPQYFIKVVSDRWLQAEHVVPVPFQNLILPEKFSALTQQANVQLKEVSSLKFEEAENVYAKDEVTEFSIIQSQCFDKLYASDDSVFIGVPTGGNERRTIAEIALFREIQKENFGTVVYLSAKKELCQNNFLNWHRRLGEQGLGLNIELLSNDLTSPIQEDILLLQRADVVISTPEKWDQMTIRCSKYTKTVGLYIFDDIHLIGDNSLQSTYEIVISRVRQLPQKTRIIAIGSPISNSKDVCEWLNIDFASSSFNFHPSIRAVCPSLGPVQLEIMPFDHIARKHRLLAMHKPIYNMLKRYLKQGDTSQSIIFTPDRKQAIKTAYDIAKFSIGEDLQDIFKGSLPEQENKLISDVKRYTEGSGGQAIASMILGGVAYLHGGMSNDDVLFIEQLYQKGIVRVLVASNELVWKLSDLQADLVIIQDPERYSSQERRYQELPIPDILQATSLAVSSSINGVAKCVIMCHTPKKDYLNKFVQEPTPLESSLAQNLHDHLSTEVVSGKIDSIQGSLDWITSTFLYRRIIKNPNYYEISGKTAQHINDYLSELVEDTVIDLAESGNILFDEDDGQLKPSLGSITSQYRTKYQTVDIFIRALTANKGSKQPNLQLKRILEILAQSAEFMTVFENNETDTSLLRRLAYNLPFDIPEDADYEDAHIQANILLQCHFSRRPIPKELKADLVTVLEQSQKLVNSMVDIIAQASTHDRQTTNTLRPAILCMELSQMLVQAVWGNQSPLYQLPHLTRTMVEQLTAAGVEDIADFMNMEDEDRQSIVGISDEQMMEVANVCNRYPNLELVIENTKVNSPTLELKVLLKRAIDESDFETKEEYLEELKVFSEPANAPFFPLKKVENWWIVVAEPIGSRLLCVQKVNSNQINQMQSHVLKIDSKMLNGNSKIKVYLICDSYTGCDLEKDFKIEN